MAWWKWVLAAWLVLAGARFLFFASRSLYLVSVRRALLDYHHAVEENRHSPHEPWLRKQRLRVQSLLFQSGQYDDAPAPSEGGRATKLNVYALESLEHWLSEHPKGMIRTREALGRAIRIYLRRAIASFNPATWFGWIFFVKR